ncbi:MAG: DUF1122 family protein [Thermoproteus sp. AZ2]|jgi:hypothetical protein|uniref:DUF1122 family protein n=1 Tax=Thermoproteus sp. AZ2 TaxID=1609232 RepID=A0ACC6V2G8_9CREN
MVFIIKPTSLHGAGPRPAMGLGELIADLARGIGGFKAAVKKGRFLEEYNLEIYLSDRRVASAKAFLGRRPYYSPWLELFAVDPSFFGSEAERELYCLLSEYMDPGDILYVEYINDTESRAQLYRGVPPEESRLGRALTACGFRIYRDWYFPEGGLEGGPKLQAVKAGGPWPTTR